MDRLEADPENLSLARDLDLRLRHLDSRLSWELGPGLSKPWQLVISPNLDRGLRDAARAIVAQAPLLPSWEFHAARQPKKWHYKLNLGTDKVTVDASDWTFVLLQYPDGVREVLLRGKGLPPLSKEERWHAAAIALESILGEEVLLDSVDEFELVDQLEPRFAEQERPIQALREAVLGR